MFHFTKNSSAQYLVHKPVFEINVDCLKLIGLDSQAEIRYIDLMPIPTTCLFVLSLSGDEVLRIRIMDSSGKMIHVISYTSGVSSAEMDLSAFPDC